MIKATIAPENVKMTVNTLNNRLTSDHAVLTDILQMSDNRITGLAAPSGDTDAISRGYANTTYVAKAGSTMTGDLNMGDHTVSNVADPEEDGDAVNLEYVNDNFLRLNGESEMEAALDMGGFRIVDVATPESDNDCATKAYVDDLVNPLPTLGTFAAGTLSGNTTFTLALAGTHGGRTFTSDKLYLINGRLTNGDTTGNLVTITHNGSTIYTTNVPTQASTGFSIALQAAGSFVVTYAVGNASNHLLMQLVQLN